MLGLLVLWRVLALAQVPEQLLEPLLGLGLGLVLVQARVQALEQPGQLRHRSRQRRWQASRQNRASIDRYCFSIHRHWRCANCGFLGRRPSLLKRMHQGQWLFCSNWLSQYFPFRDQSSVAAGL